MRHSQMNEQDDEQMRKSLLRLQTISSHDTQNQAQSYIDDISPQKFSEYNPKSAQESEQILKEEQVQPNAAKSEKKWMLGIELKPGISRINLSYIFLLNFMAFLIMNTKIGLDQPTLENPKYYNLSSEATINLLSIAASVCSIPTMFWLLLSGVIMDQYGRKWILFIMALFSSLSLIFVPIVSPNQSAYCGLTILENLCVIPLVYNPLINDYVEHTSIGRMMAVNQSCVLLGLILGLSVFFGLLKNLDPLYAYLILGLVFVLIALITAVMAKDPPDLKIKSLMKKKVRQGTEREGVADDTKKALTAWQIIKSACLAIKNDYELVVAYFMMFFLMGQQVMILLYVRNWIYHFYEDKNGPLKSIDDVNFFYQYQGTVGTIIAFFMMIPTAKFIDKISPKILIAFGFVQRALLNFSYYYMSSPDTLAFYMIAPLYHYGIFFLAVLVQTYLQKKYPKSIRGILMNIGTLVSTLGTLAYTLAVNVVFQRYGFRSPFLMATFGDIAVAVVCLVLGLGGCITNKKPEENDDEENTEKEKQLVKQTQEPHAIE